jgi:hypothetical protein
MEMVVRLLDEVLVNLEKNRLLQQWRESVNDERLSSLCVVGKFAFTLLFL